MKIRNHHTQRELLILNKYTYINIAELVMKKVALVTGIAGQDGAYLAKLLLEKNYKVYGLVRRYTNPNFSNLDYLGVTSDVDLVQGDMTDEGSLMNIIRGTRPDEIYNLAAQSFVGASWDQAKYTSEVDAMGVLYLLNAMKHFVPTAKFYQASTSEMFGNAHENGWQTENTPFKPRSPYAIAKLYAHWMTINFRESYSLYTCSGVLFNHESPIRGKEFVTRKITDGVARIKAGLDTHISLGNTDSSRDWGFAGDYVEAMWMMLQQDQPDDYLIATGETHTIAEFLDIAFAEIGVSDWSNYVTLDPRFKRPAELFALKGDSSKTRTKLGWSPKTDFQSLVKMMMDADLKRHGV
jgi:GDPmannose 4,6-dehydratase